MTLLIESMKGLGDNIYQRLFVRAAAAREPVYITTPWPELYVDFESVRFTYRDTPLRTQRKNLRRQLAQRWSPPPPRTRCVTMGYGGGELADGSIVAAMERRLPLGAEGFVFDLPAFDPPALAAGPRPVAVVRPVTIRREWESRARGPRPEYIQQAIGILKARGFYVVSVADVEPGQEWFEGPEPTGMDIAFHRGELTIEPLLGLIRNAAVVVGGVGWIVPACIAARRPLYCVLGGRGGHNAPDKITDPRMDLRRVGWAMPDHYCMCVEPAHACDKTIDDFTGGLERFLSSLGGPRD